MKNRVDEVTEKAVTGFVIDYPACGQVRASNELRKKGIFVSSSGVRSIWLRHSLESMKLRLFALEKKSAEEGLILTEAQVQALDKKKDDDATCGEIENCHPGYLGSQVLFMSVQSRELDAFISKCLLIHTQNGLLPNFTRQRPPYRRQIF